MALVVVGRDVCARSLEEPAVTHGAVTDERLTCNLSSSGLQARGPSVNTSPRFASSTGVPGRRKASSVGRAGDRNIEGEGQRACCGEADPNAREAARAAADHDRVELMRFADQPIDRVGSRSPARPARARPPDARAQTAP